MFQKWNDIFQDTEYATLTLRKTAGYVNYSVIVKLQRQFLALRRAGALPLQACLERRGLRLYALPTHRELPFIYK